MRKLNFLKTMLLLCALIAGSRSVWAADSWVKTAPADLSTGDIIVVVDLTSEKAMEANGSSAPKATSVTLNGGKTEITSSVASELQWTLTTSGNGDSKTFQLGQDTDFLYVTNTNNGVRVGSGDRKTFTIVTGGDNSGYYLYNVSGTDKRYIGCYNSADWRCYTSINKNIQGNNIAFYKKTTVGGPVDPSVTISSTSVAKGSTVTIDFPSDLTTISFESNDETVATVSNAGVVSGIKAGSAKITATWTAKTDTYNAGSKEFTVTVVATTVYEKVTSANQLVPGNEYILVATGNNMAMGAQNGSYRTSVAVTVSDNKVAITDEEVAVLTLGGSKDEWTFLASDNDSCLALKSASNALHISNDATVDASKWVVTSDFQLESANFSGRVIKYNAGSPRFACYASSQQAAYLFVKSGGKAIIAINEACTDGAKYYATYSSSKGFIVPSDLTVSEISVIDGELYIEDYEVGATVPANTGVLVASATYGEHNISLANGGTSVLGSDNMLKPSGDAGVTAGDMTGGDKYYRLTMHNGETLGFWWGAADGAAFALGANKAYLAVPNAALAGSAREGLWFGDDLTGIGATLNDNVEMTNDKPVYNLAGQRVSQPSKGLYIVGGKKVALR